MNTIRIINTKNGQMAKLFDSIQWCIKAITQDHVIDNLKHLYIDKDFMAGCDGHRMHIALNEWDLEPGLYEILTLKVNEILLAKSETLSLENYPSIWSQVPSQCKNSIPPFYCSMGRKHELNNKSCFAYHVFMNTHRCYNLKYLEDVRTEGYMHFEIGENKPMLLVASEDHDRLGMIMPLKH